MAILSSFSPRIALQRGRLFSELNKIRIFLLNSRWSSASPTAAASATTPSPTGGGSPALPEESKTQNPDIHYSKLNFVTRPGLRTSQRKRSVRRFSASFSRERVLYGALQYLGGHEPMLNQFGHVGAFLTGILPAPNCTMLVSSY